MHSVFYFLMLLIILFGVSLDSPMVQWVKNLPVMQETKETQVQSLGWEDPLEGEMATHSFSYLKNPLIRVASWAVAQKKCCKESDMTDKLSTANNNSCLVNNHRLCRKCRTIIYLTSHT